MFISRVSFFVRLFKEKKRLGGKNKKARCHEFFVSIFGNVDGFLSCNMVILWCLCLEHLFVTFK